MKNVEISVIVPVYNVEKYLAQCIESILTQTFADFELLLINDGSTDRSGNICDAYAEQDSRIRVVHKENGGVSSARNCGLEVAQGKYVSFIDSDDYVGKDYLSTMHTVMMNTDADCVITGIIYVSEGQGNVPCPMPEVRLGRWDELNLYYPEIFRKAGFASVYANLYKTKIIQQNQICFLPYSYAEDTMFVASYLQMCRNCALTDYAGYYYRQYTADSLTKKYHTNTIDAIDEKFRSSKWILDFLDERNSELFYQDFFFSLWNQMAFLYIRGPQTAKEKLLLLRSYLSRRIVKEIMNEVQLRRYSFKWRIRGALLRYKPVGILHLFLLCHHRNK